MKYKSVAARCKNFLNLYLLKSFTISDFLKSSFVQILFASSYRGTIVHRESTFKVPIQKSGFESTVSSVKWKESFTVNSLVVKGFKIYTKMFECLYRYHCSKMIKLFQMGSNGLRLIWDHSFTEVATRGVLYRKVLLEI